MVRSKPPQEPGKPPIDALVGLIDSGLEVDAIRDAIEKRLDLQLIVDELRDGAPAAWQEAWIYAQ